MRFKWIAALALSILSTAAFGQGAQFPAGTVWGNDTAAQRPGKAATVSAILDRALGSTRGAIIERGASGWGIVGPGATAGLAWISGGTGADPAYGVLGLVGGGCNAALTASNGGILYSTASACSILAGTATARKMLQSGSSAAPAWSTTTWPATTTINRILYSSSANVIGEITTANGGLLNTSGSGVPSITPTPILGVAGSVVGTIGFQNATSGGITLSPPTGALGSATLTLPAATDTLVGKATTDTLTNKTLMSPVINTIQSPTSVQFLNGGNANGIHTGSLCSTASYANCSSVPANGIYTKGDIAMAGSTSGLGSLKAPAAASSYIWTLPATTATLTGTIASGTSTLGSSAISSATCATVVTTAATNTATTDVVVAGFQGDVTGVTGYIPSTSGMLTIIAYPTANNVNFKVCNNTASSITPGAALVINWRVIR